MALYKRYVGKYPIGCSYCKDRNECKEQIHKCKTRKQNLINMGYVKGEVK